MRMQAKLSSMLLSVTTLLFIGFGFYQYLQIRDSITADLQSRATFVIKRLKENLSIPLWDADLNQVEKILLTEMHDPHVAAIVVKDHRAEILKAKYRNEQWEPADQRGLMATTSGLMQTDKILREKDSLGAVEVTVTFKFMQSRLRREVARILVVMLVLDSLLFLVLIFMTRHVVVSPIRQLVNMAHAVSEGNFQTHIPLDTSDEIGEVACSFRTMEDKISEVLQEITMVIQAVQQGDLSIRGRVDDLSGGWRELVSGVNDLIQAFVTPITIMAQRIQEISMGELPGEIGEEYYGDFQEIKDHLNVMIRNLRSFATNIRTVSKQVAAMSQELSVNTEELSQSVSHQASATEEISATTEEMTSSILHTAGNAKKTEEIALKSANAAKEGALSVAEAIRAMQKIAETLPVIEEIAGRTNLLSLNASIEAAKAQEYGKGFAVVANEVRNLALQSQNAAKEIKELTRVMLQLAATANDVLERLLPDSQHTAELVQEISLANSEQSYGADQINQAIQHLDETTQQHAMIASETAEMSQKLARQSERLQQIGEFFILDDAPQVCDDDLQILFGKLQTTAVGESRIQILTRLAHRILQEVESRQPEQTARVRKKHPTQEYKPPSQVELSLSSDEIREDLDQDFEQY